jgi:hypothetical protein
MAYEEGLDEFVDKWGGRTRFYELVEAITSTSDGQFAEELSELIEQNPLAKKLVRDIVSGISSTGQLGETVRRPFQGTPETWGKSTDDDFFKAKSHEFLMAAELRHDLEAAARNEEEGWPDNDRDIGDA